METTCSKSRAQRKPTNHHNDAYGISYPKEREDLSKWLHKPNSDKEKEKKTDSPKPENKKPDKDLKPSGNPFNDKIYQNGDQL